MTTPMFRAIKEKYPDSYLAAYTNSEVSFEFLGKFGLGIDKLVRGKDIKKNYIREYVKTISLLRKEKFDFSFLTSTRIARQYFIIPFLSGIMKRYGIKKKGLKKYDELIYKILLFLLTDYITFLVDKDHRVTKNLELLKFINISNRNLSYYINKYDIDKKNIIGIHPGSDKNGGIKRWSADKFNHVAQILSLKYDYKVRIFIGPDEEELVDSFEGNLKVKVIRNERIESVLEYIAQCSFFISNDSGLSHVASAFLIPVILIMGPTHINEYKLPTKYKIVEKKFSCRPCFQKRIKCPFNLQCLEKIEVEEVISSFEELKRESNGIKLG